MMKKSKVIAVAAAVVLLGSLLNWAMEKHHVDTTIRVGTEMMNPPFEFSQGNNSYTGFDIELTQAISRELGYNWELKPMYFNRLIPALQQGDIDMIISAMDATDIRSQQMEFTDPYFYGTGYVVMVREDSDIRKGIDELEERVVGVQNGTVAMDIAKAIPRVQLVEFDASSQCLFALSSGEVDAIVIERPVGLYYLNQGVYPNIKIVGESMRKSPMVMAVKKGDTEFRDDINRALKKLRETGEYQKIYEKWFGKL